LGVAYFHLAYFRFLPPYIGFAFFFILEAGSFVQEFQKRRRTVVSVFVLFRPDSGGREETLLSPQLSF
jgi:hypothetical protein